MQPERVEDYFRNLQRQIQELIKQQSDQIDVYRADLEREVETTVDGRLARLEKHHGIVRQLNIPLARCEDAPALEPLELDRRLVRPLPSPPDSCMRLAWNWNWSTAEWISECEWTALQPSGDLHHRSANTSLLKVHF